MSFLMILLTIFLPPVAVLLKEGLGLQFLLNVILTLIGWLPAAIWAMVAMSLLTSEKAPLIDTLPALATSVSVKSSLPRFTISFSAAASMRS